MFEQFIKGQLWPTRIDDLIARNELLSFEICDAFFIGRDLRPLRPALFMRVLILHSS